MIADYMFNKFTVPAGYRLCVVLSSGPMSSGALGNLTGKTLADLRALGSTLATAVPAADVGAFGFRIERSQTSAYGQKYVPAFSVPSQCVYSPVKSGTVTYVILALLDGSTAAAKVVRCYQCSAGLSGAEAKLSRTTVSAEDKAFTAKLELTGIPGQQVGSMERNLRPAPIASAVAMIVAAERTLHASPSAPSAVGISNDVTETVQPDAKILA
jgi:hypothetical protein